MTRILCTDTLALDGVEIDQSGMLRAKARIARVGVQDYLDEQGKVRRRLRPVDEVEKSTSSFSSQVVTLNHPEDQGVTADNSRQYMRGFTGQASFEDGWIKSDIVVTSTDAIRAAKTSHRYFSCGYYADIEETGGIWKDEMGVMGAVGKSYEYDEIQRNIRGNHIALVTAPRAGYKATFCADSQEEDEYENCRITIHCMDAAAELAEDKKQMAKIVYDNQVLEIGGNDADAVVKIFSDLKKEAEAKTQLDSVNADLITKLKAAQQENDLLQGKLDGAEANIKKLQQQVDSIDVEAEVKSRIALIERIKPHLDEIDYGATPVELKKRYLAKVLPNNQKIQDASEAYLDGLIDAVQPATKNDEIGKAFESDSAKPHGKGAEDAMQQAQEEYMKSRRKGGAK